MLPKGTDVMDHVVFSRRVLLQAAAAATVLAPERLALAHAPIPTRIRVDRLANSEVFAVLVAHAPELCFGLSAGQAPTCLYAVGLVPVALATSAGLTYCTDTAASLQQGSGDAARLGLVAWGPAANWRAIALMSDTATAVVLIDPIDAPREAHRSDGPRVLCHFATRCSRRTRHRIELSLAKFERAGTPLTYHWYDAEPGFAAPGQRFGAAADLVWRRTAAFLSESLAQPEGSGLPLATDNAVA
jgi:hypothetical protein